MKRPLHLIFTALGFLGLAGLTLWWLADHRRGMAWAISFIRRLFPDVAHLSVADLGARLHDAEQTPPLLVDARTSEEYAVSHLPGAVRVDPRLDVSGPTAAFDGEQPVVVYCAAGYRGAALARKLRAAGFRRVWNLEGGIFAWANAEMPLESDGQPAHRVHPFARSFSRLLKSGKAVVRLLC